jgi:hypothetical protein
MIGHIGRTVGFASWYFSGQSSEWSPTQTVTIPADSSSPYPSQTVPVPTHSSGLPPENPLLVVIAIALIVLAVLLAVVFLFLIKGWHRKTTNLKQ